MKASILSLGLLAGTALAFPQDMDSMTEALRENALAQLAQKDQAAFTFIYRFMSNKSAEYPSGVLNRNVIKSFMSIRQGSDGSLTWVPGNERIPDDWYKRNPSDEYSVPYFESDILYFAQTVPEVLQVGCNTGRVNSFNRISPEASQTAPTPPDRSLATRSASHQSLRRLRCLVSLDYHSQTLY